MPKKLLPVALVLFIVVPGVAQYDTIKVRLSGVVRDSITGEAMPNVHIVAYQRGTVSDLEGKFTICVVKGDTLHFTHVNYNPVTIEYAHGKHNDFIDVRMLEQVTWLKEARVLDTPSEEELKNRILSACVVVSKEEKIAGENSEKINHIGRIAPQSAPTLSEQYFQSLQGPKDVTILSSNGGLIKAIRNFKVPPKTGTMVPASSYRPDRIRVNLFKVKMRDDSVRRDTIDVIKKLKD